MTHDEIRDAIYALTNRPDLVSETEQMLQAATLRMHQSDFYSRDIAEAQIDLGTDGYAFSFSAPSTFTRFRALQYLRKYDPVTATAGKILDKVDPLNLLNGFGIEKNDVWYVGGANTVVRSSTAIRYLLAGWYQNPTIGSTNGTYASWIADLVPHAIVFDAASMIFQMINQQEQSRKFDSLVAEQVHLVAMHGLDGRGY